MSLDLGELVGTLGMDVTPFDNALAHGDQALVAFGATARSSAETAGTKASAGFGAGLKLEAEVKAEGDAATTKLGTALGGMDDEARAAGAAASTALGSGLADAKTEAGDAGKEAAGRFSDEFKQGAKDAGKVAGLAVGAGLGIGVADNLNIESGRAVLQAQLGLTAGDAKKAGELAGAIYVNNFGENLDDINGVIALAVKNMGLGLGSVDIQPAVEKLLTLRDVFEIDLPMASAAAGQMVKTGMAKDVTEALDIITVGLQSPANKADDLLETFNEYGTQFRKLGLDGPDALGLINQAIQGGARDADIAADAFKEFSIRAIDGSVLTSKGFEDLGLNAEKMAGKIGKGGPVAREALDVVLDRLRDVEDPAKRAAIATALFGTQSEDLGDALFKMDLSTATKGMGEVAGAADAVTEATGSTTQATIETYKRKIIDAGREAIESTGPTAALAGAVAAVGPAVLGVLGPVASLIAARSAQKAAAATGAAAELGASGVSIGAWLASAAASTASAIAMAAAWLIAIAPIAIVIATIVGVAYLIYKHWDDIKEYTVKAWNATVDFVKAIPGKIIGFFQGWALPGKVKDAFGDMKDGAVTKSQELLSWVAGLPGKAVDKLASIGDDLKEKGKDALAGLKEGAVDKWTDVSAWVGSIPQKALDSIGNVAGTLKDKGKDLLGGAKDGLTEKWGDVSAWFGGIPERVLAAVGNLAGVLKDAGIAIIAGFLKGLLEKWEDVKDAVGGMGSWIKDHKGPESYDRALLRPAGRWIMEGLGGGLDDRLPMLKRKLGVVSDTIAGADLGTLTATTTAATAPVDPTWEDFYRTAPPPGGGAAPNMEFKIYETTDPQATAAEVSRRQAFAGAGA